MKKFLHLFGYLVLIIGLTGGINHAKAKEKINETDLVNLEEAEQIATNYIKIVSDNSYPDWKTASIEPAEELYDFDGNLTSYLFQVRSKGVDQGYVIVSASNFIPGVLESTREGSNPYKDGITESKIYVGPLMHYIKYSADELIDLKNNKKLKKNALKSKGPYSKKNIVNQQSTTLKNQNVSLYASNPANYTYKLISGVGDFTWQVGCGPTAAANILKYWDSRGYGNLIYSTQSTASLTSELGRFMKTDSTGSTTFDNLASGTRNFWYDRGYSVDVQQYGAYFNTHMNIINSGTPNYVLTQDHPTYRDHIMTGIGYESYYSDLSWHQQLIVHDTYSSTPVDCWVVFSPAIYGFTKVQP